MTGNMYGYARVSTHVQNEARQLTALREFGVLEENIIVEKQSGKDFDRPLYLGLVEALQPEDVLVVQSIDRLGRNYADILEQWRHITKELEAAIVVLDMPLLDTRAGRDLTGILIADIVLQILSYVAQKQAEGIAAALARGVRFGRRRVDLPEDFAYMAELWAEGFISATVAARDLGMSRDTFLRRAREAYAACAGEVC